MEFRTLECLSLPPSVISLTPFCIYLYEPEMHLGSLEKFLFISAKISYSDWNHIFNLRLCIKNMDNKETSLFPACAKLFSFFPFCFTLKEMKAKEICVGKPSPWGWALTCDGSRTETHRIYSKLLKGIFSFFTQLILSCSVCQDIMVGDMCPSKRLKLFYTAASDLKAFQTLSGNQVLV